MAQPEPSLLIPSSPWGCSLMRAVQGDIAWCHEPNGQSPVGTLTTWSENGPSHLSPGKVNTGRQQGNAEYTCCVSESPRRRLPVLPLVATMLTARLFRPLSQLPGKTLSFYDREKVTR